MFGLILNFEAAEHVHFSILPALVEEKKRLQSFGGDLRLSALSDYLKAHVAGYPGKSTDDLTVEQFKGGQSNPTYKLTTPAGSYVMRSKPEIGRAHV